MSHIRGELRETTSLAFWETCIDGRPVAEVAKEVKTTAGNVSVRRSRIMARLGENVQELHQDDL